jgi:hypothetical protein
MERALMPRKTFVAGELATASDVNTYLMDQSVMTFASAAARTTAIPSPTEGMVTYLEANDHLSVYNGSAWIQFDTGWTTYTPTLNNVTLGSGSVMSAAYTHFGKTVIVTFSFVFGTGTTITGDVNFSLPINHANTNRAGGSGNAVIVDASPLTRYHGNAYPSGTPSFAFIRAFNAAGTYVTEVALSSSIPIPVWAINDTISVTLIYQAA